MTTCTKRTCTKAPGPLSILPTSFADLVAKVGALDLNPIKSKLMNVDEGEGWTRDHADAVERQYRNFLVLAGFEPCRSVVPFADVDTFWHYHILDTKKYAEDCDSVFGYFLHHYPYFGTRGPKDRALLSEATIWTRRRYQELFGAIDDDDKARTCTEKVICTPDVVCGSRSPSVGDAQRPTC